MSKSVDVEVKDLTELPEPLRPLFSMTEAGTYQATLQTPPTEDEQSIEFRRRYATVLTSHKNRVTDLERKLAAKTRESESHLIAGRVSYLAAQSGNFVPSALDEAKDRALKLFEIRQGEVTKRDAESPYDSVDDWFEAAKQEKPHWFRIRIGGANVRSSGVRGGNGVTLSREEARDPQRYREAKARSKDGIVRIR